MSLRTILVIDSDAECQRILLNVGLLGTTKPVAPDNITVTTLLFRHQGKRYEGIVIHFANPAPEDNGYQIAAVESPASEDEREALLSLVPTDCTSPWRVIPHPEVSAS